MKNAKLIGLTIFTLILAAILPAIAMAGEKEVKQVYSEILSIQYQIVERSEMRFSDDMEKGEASHSLSISSQLVTVASNVVETLNNKAEVTEIDYVAAEKELKEIKSEIQKLNE